MAFLFSGYQTSDDDGKQDIFSEGGQVTQPETGQSAGKIPKTSEGGQAVSGAATAKASATPKVTAGSGGYNPKAAQSSYSRLAQSIQLPTQTIKGTQENIQGAQQKLQEEANRYASSQAQQRAAGNISEETLSKAGAGDEAAYQQVAQRLTQARPQTEAFGGLSELPGTADVRNLEAAYKPGSYTAGQKAFDAAMLRRNSEYRKIQEQLLGQQKALSEANQKAQTEQTAAAQKASDEAYAAETKRLREALSGQASGIVSAAQAKAKAEEERRAGLDTKAIASNEYQKLLADLREQLGRAPKGTEQADALTYLNNPMTGFTPGDLSKYVTVNQPGAWQNYVDQGEAEKYNRLQSLLGEGSSLQAGMGTPEDYTFNMGAAYQDILGQLTGKVRQGREAQAYVQSPEGQAAIANALKGVVPAAGVDIGNVDMSSVPIATLPGPDSIKTPPPKKPGSNETPAQKKLKSASR